MKSLNYQSSTNAPVIGDYFTEESIMVRRCIHAERLRQWMVKE